MTLHDVLETERAEILRVAAAHGAVNGRVFGSVAREADVDHSDVELLVEATADARLIARIGANAFREFRVP